MIPRLTGRPILSALPNLLLLIGIAGCQASTIGPTPTAQTSQPPSALQPSLEPSSSVDPLSAEAGRVVATIELGDVQPWRIAWGEGRLWVLGRRGAETVVFSVDPKANRLEGQAIVLTTHGWDIAAGAGGVWVARCLGRCLPHRSSGETPAQRGGPPPRQAAATPPESRGD